MTGGRADPNHARQEWGLNSLMTEQVVPTLKRSSSDERDGRRTSGRIPRAIVNLVNNWCGSMVSRIASGPHRIWPASHLEE